MPTVTAANKFMPKKKRTKSSSILLESTRQFCEINRPTIEDISTYKAFFYQFIDTLPDTDKRQVAAVLARNPYTPRPIGLYLAMDRLEVAAPFLLFSPILKEMDLKAISRKMGEEYAAVIKRRDCGKEILGVNKANLNSSTGILNNRVIYNDDVILDVQPIDNSALIPSAVSNTSIKSTLEKMKNIPAAFETSNETPVVNVVPAANLANNVSDTAHNSANESNTDGNVSIDTAIDETDYISSHNSGKKETWLSSDEIVALASVGGKLGKKTDRDGLNETTELPDRTSIQLAQSGNHPSNLPLKKIEIATLIKHARAVDHQAFSKSVSRISGLSENRVMSLIGKKEGDELLYLIKALNVPSPKDLQLLLMLAPKHGRGIKKYMAAKKLFSELNVGVCRMIFNEVGANFEIPGAPKPVHIDGTRQDENFNHSVKMRREHISANSRINANQKQDAKFVTRRKAS